MNPDDIFARAEEETLELGEFFKFTTVGDRIPGTFVGLLESVDGYGNDQYVVILRNAGINHRVAVRKNHTVLVDQLKQVRFGQIIGFSFKEERESKVKGGAKSKIINLAQAPGMVDDQWIKEKLAIDAKYGLTPEESLRPKFDTASTAPQSTDPVAPQATVPFGPEPTAPVATPVTPNINPIFTTIRNLAISKGIVQEGTKDSDIDEVIKTITGFEMTEANTTQIIMKLSTTL